MLGRQSKLIDATIFTSRRSPNSIEAIVKSKVLKMTVRNLKRFERTETSPPVPITSLFFVRACHAAGALRGSPAFHRFVEWPDLKVSPVLPLSWHHGA